MEITGNNQILEEFFKTFTSESFDIEQKRSFGFDVNDIAYYLTAGGGALGFAKCIISYLKLHYQKRKFILTTKEGVKIEIETISEKELANLLEKTTIIQVLNSSKQVHLNKTGE